jgi:exoribonuclease R
MNNYDININYVGYFSTSDKVIFGKNKAGKIIYQIKPFAINLPKILVPYGGKLKGKIIILFKINKIFDNYLCGETINIIGLMNESTLLITLQHIYYIYRKNILNYSTNLNSYENNISRKKINKFIFSIDPPNSFDVDDAISYEFNDVFHIISIYIAQPICFLTEDLLVNRAKYAFSTLYSNNKNNNLWSDEITFNSSFLQNYERYAYCIEFYIDNNLNISKIDHFPSIIVNNIQTTYDQCLTYPIIKNFYDFTNKLQKSNDNNEFTTHDLISYWMVVVNNYLGNLDYVKSLNIPYRIIKENYDIKILNEYLDIKNIEIKNIFINKICNSAIYTNTTISNINYHSILKKYNYIHFTSPIRRIIDTLTHWCITYNVNFNTLLSKYDLNLDHINKLSKNTNKYHKNLNLLNTIENIFKSEDNIDISGNIFKKSDSNNLWTIYFKDFGFQKVKIWDNKFNYLITTCIKQNINNINIGDKYIFKIYKKNGFLPYEKLLIVPLTLKVLLLPLNDL